MGWEEGRTATKERSTQRHEFQAGFVLFLLELNADNKWQVCCFSLK